MKHNRFWILALVAALGLLIGVAAYSPAMAAPEQPAGETWDTSCGQTFLAYSPNTEDSDVRVPQADGLVSCWTDEDGVKWWEIRQNGMAANDANKPAFALRHPLPQANVCHWYGWQAMLWDENGNAVVNRFTADDTVIPLEGRHNVIADDFEGGPGAGFLIVCEGVTGDNEPEPDPEPLDFWADAEGHAAISACYHHLEELPGSVTLQSAEGAALGLLLNWEGVLCGGYAAQFGVSSVYTVTINTTIPLTISQDAVQAGWTMFENGWRRELPAPPEPPVPPVVIPWVCSNPMVAEKVENGAWVTMPAEYQPRADNVDGKLIVGQWQIPHPSAEHGFCLMLPAGEVVVKAAGSKVLLADQTLLVNHEEKTLNLATPTWVFVQEAESPDQGGVVFEAAAVYDPNMYTRGMIMAEFLPMISRQ